METNIFVDNENLLLAAIEEIDNALELGKQGILRQDELEKVQRRSHNRIEAELDKNSTLWRLYDKDKSFTRYYDVSRNIYTTNKNVETALVWLRKYAVQALEQKDNQQHKKEHFIDKGEYVKGRKILRDILATAKTDIWIQDNFIVGGLDDIEFLYIIQPYLENNKSLSVKLLTINVSNPFKADFNLFNKQFENRLELRLHNNAHDRYVIIDQKDVYQFGGSIKDLGSKATQITINTEQTEKDKVIKAFQDWYSNGIAIIANK